MSLSARRAWIEIQWVWMPLALPVVALRKESVDRNIFVCYTIDNERVALRKESVDRNAQNPAGDIHRPPSLSARRAWIEIGGCLWAPGINFVALRKESVDRNACPKKIGCLFCASLSARRAWIEMAAVIYS